ncbi:hypothetical protein F5Y02DRAFT_398571 [Annulohypoxylon stygium]|nr:hypothetical protein F5Y02DRAFT_398571 [Annulohypoxylon stygium]
MVRFSQCLILVSNNLTISVAFCSYSSLEHGCRRACLILSAKREVALFWQTLIRVPYRLTNMRKPVRRRCAIDIDKGTYLYTGYLQD